MTDYPTTGSAAIRVAASPAAVFALLTDLERLPLLSPENERCELRKDFDTIGLGAKFRGFNNNHGYEWHADCEVTVFEPDAAFAYVVPPKFEHATTWRYDIKADGDGCIVTESFDAPMLALPDVYPGELDGRCDNLIAACELTMANLKAAVE